MNRKAQERSWLGQKVKDRIFEKNSVYSEQKVDLETKRYLSNDEEDYFSSPQNNKNLPFKTPRKKSCTNHDLNISIILNNWWRTQKNNLFDFDVSLL